MLKFLNKPRYSVDRVVGLGNVMNILNSLLSSPINGVRYVSSDGNYRIEFMDNGVTIPVDLTPREFMTLIDELSRDSIFRVSINDKYIIEQFVKGLPRANAEQVLKFFSDNKVQLLDMEKLTAFIKKAGTGKFTVYWIRHFEVDTAWDIVYVQNKFVVILGSPLNKYYAY